jgi:transposase InsO family protein
MDERMRFVTRTEGTPLSEGLHPNDLWAADYKGEFRLGDQRYCYPLTVTDHASRYLLLCEALESNREELAFRALEPLFKEGVCRSPFARITGFRSLRPTGCSICRGFRCGGCVWALRSNASGPVTPSKTAGMNACT